MPGLPGLGGLGSAPAAGTLGSAEFVLVANADQLIGSLDAVRGSVDQLTQQIAQSLGQQEQVFKQSHDSIGRAVQSSTSTLSGFAQGVNEITRIAAGFTVATTLTGAFQQIADSIRGAISASVEFGQETQRIQGLMGNSAEAASSTLAVFDRYGVSMQQTTRTITSLAQAMDTFLHGGPTGTGSTAASQALDDLQEYGLRLTDVAGKSKSLSDLMPDVFDALSKIEDPIRRDTDASALFGYRWAQLAPIISGGHQAWDEAIRSAVDMGATLDDVSEKKMQAMFLAQHEVEEATKALGIAFTEALSGPYGEFSAWAVKLIDAWAKNKTGLDGMTEGVTQLGQAIQQFAPAFEVLGAMGSGDWGKVGQAFGREVLKEQQRQMDQLAESEHWTPEQKARLETALGIQATSLSVLSGGAISLPAPAESSTAPSSTDAARAAADAQTAALKSAADQKKELDDQKDFLKEWAKQHEAAIKANWERGRVGQESPGAAPGYFLNPSTGQQEILVGNPKQWYDDQITLRKNAYDDELDAAKTNHEAVIADLKLQVQDANDQYQRDLANLQAAEQGKLDAAKATHEANLAAIKAQVDQANQNYTLQKNATAKEGDLAVSGLEWGRDYQIGQIQAGLERLHEQWQKDDAAQRISEQQADFASQKTHTQKLQDLKSEQDTFQRDHDARLETDQDAARQAKENIEDATTLYDDQHRARLAAIDDEKQAAQDQHESALRAIQAEKQAAQDQHDAVIEGLQNEQYADQRRHSDAVEGIRREQQAEHDALQDQISLIDEAAAKQKDAINEQLAALQAQQQAQDRAAQDRRNQENLAKAEQQLHTDITAGGGGDPSRVLADQQSLADAQYAIQQQTQQRQNQDQQSTLKQQLQDIQTAAQAQKQALQDAQRERDAANALLIAQLNDQLQAELDSIRQRTQAENAAWQVQQRIFAQEAQDETARYQRQIRQLQEQTQAENEAAQKFHEAQAKKARDVDDGLHKQTEALNAELAVHKAIYDAEVVSENARYTNEQQATRITRAQAAELLRVQRQQTDDAAKADTAAVKLHFDSAIVQTKGYYAALAGDLERTHNDTITKLGLQTIAENLHWDGVQKDIKNTYESKVPNDNGVMGLIPELEKAHTETTRTLGLRQAAEDLYWEHVQKQIHDKFYSTDPENPGLITVLETAKSKTDALIVDELSNWETWATQVVKNANSVRDAFNEIAAAIERGNTARDRKPATGGGGSAPAEGGGEGQAPTYGPSTGAWDVQFGFGQTYTGSYRTGTPHRGIDLTPHGAQGNIIGTPIGAFESGTVTASFYDPGGAGGNIVYVLDQNGLTHAYMHLQRASVKPGDTIEPGQIIGLLGETGTEGSPHLHYEVRRNAATGDPLDQLIDPRPWVYGVAYAPQGTAGDTRQVEVGIGPQTGGTYRTEAEADALAYGLDPNLFVRQIQQESAFDPNARSWAGAVGIAQFMPPTAASLGINPLDPHESLRGAAMYDAMLIQKYGSFRNALWAYNAGEGNFQMGIMPDETRQYLQAIVGYANGGMITVPTLLSELGTGKPYAIAGEAGWEQVTPIGAGAGAPGAVFHFDVRGPGMADVSYQMRREFERSAWLHQGWR